MQSTKYNIVAEQAATYQLNITWNGSDGQPVDLTNFHAKMQIRLGFNEPDAIVTVDDSDGITLGGELGTIAIVISAEQTALLRAPQVFVYDLRMTNDLGGEVTRLIEGTFTTIPAVTRG